MPYCERKNCNLLIDIDMLWIAQVSFRPQVVTKPYEYLTFMRRSQGHLTGELLCNISINHAFPYNDELCTVLLSRILWRDAYSTITRTMNCIMKYIVRSSTSSIISVHTQNRQCIIPTTIQNNTTIKNVIHRIQQCHINYCHSAKLAY